MLERLNVVLGTLTISEHNNALRQVGGGILKE